MSLISRYGTLFFSSTILAISPALGANFSVSTAVTSGQTLADGNTGTVTNNGSIITSGSTVGVTITPTTTTNSVITLTNDGTISQTGTGRAIRNNTSSKTSQIIINNNGTISSVGTATIGGNVAISNNRGTVTIDSAVFTTGVTMAEVTILNTSNTAISETLTYYPDSSSVRTTSRVQFKNLLGGCDSLYFNDNIQNLEAQSSAIRTTGSWNTYFVDNDNVYTLEMNANNIMLAWLEELKLSKVVYFNSVRCKIVDGNMVVQSRDFTTFVLTLKAGRKLLN